MSWLKTVWRELVSIFIDDSHFALAIVIWLALIGLLVSHLIWAVAWQGIVLFVGLAVVLVESVLRRSRRP